MQQLFKEILFVFLMGVGVSCKSAEWQRPHSRKDKRTLKKLKNTPKKKLSHRQWKAIDKHIDSLGLSGFKTLLERNNPGLLYEDDMQTCQQAVEENSTLPKVLVTLITSYNWESPDRQDKWEDNEGDVAYVILYKQLDEKRTLMHALAGHRLRCIPRKVQSIKFVEQKYLKDVSSGKIDLQSLAVPVLAN